MKKPDKKNFIKIRIQVGKNFYFGPGKVLLLQTISLTGSISSAAKEIGMSYKKAWRLIKEINDASSKKIVITNTGGKGAGGAIISEEGLKFISLYKKIENKVILDTKKEKNLLEKIFLEK